MNLARTSLALLAAPGSPLAGAAWDERLAWIDVVGLTVVALLALLGLIRGLWWQVVRLLGLAAAVALARTLGPELTPQVQRLAPQLDLRIAQGAAWVGVFLLALAAVAWIGKLGRRILTAAHLDLVDRFGGALAGGLTGALLHTALLVAVSQLGPAGWVRATLAGTQSERLLEACGRRWPVVLAEEAGATLWAAPGQPPESDGTEPDLQPGVQPGVLDPAHEPAEPGPTGAEPAAPVGTVR